MCPGSRCLSKSRRLWSLRLCPLSSRGADGAKHRAVPVAAGSARSLSSHPRIQCLYMLHDSQLREGALVATMVMVISMIDPRRPSTGTIGCNWATIKLADAKRLTPSQIERWKATLSGSRCSTSAMWWQVRWWRQMMAYPRNLAATDCDVAMSLKHVE